jgi:hypothetical protein
MSFRGHRRTLPYVHAMSALGQKRTRATHAPMSALGQKGTFRFLHRVRMFGPMSEGREVNHGYNSAFLVPPGTFIPPANLGSSCQIRT